MLLLLASLLALADQSVFVTPATAPWKHDAGDPPGAESIILRDDPQTGALEFFNRYPAGHLTRAHWHSVNERILVIEGKIEFRAGDRTETLEPGGYAYLPAKQTHQMKCLAATRCAFYLYWDGKPDFHRD